MKYTVIRVVVRSGNTAVLDDRQVEVERYLYGRWFFLDRRPVADTDPKRPMHELFFLVERHYAGAIIPRLASGLFWAREVNVDELNELLDLEVAV